MNLEVVQAEISKLELKPGQILAVRFHQKLDVEMLRHVQEYMRRLVPKGVKIAVLDNNAEFIVVDPRP